MIESHNSLHPREAQKSCGTQEVRISGLCRSPRGLHPQQQFGTEKFSLQRQSQQGIESHTLHPHTTHIYNIYMSEQSSPQYILYIFSAREFAAPKISPAKNYLNPFSDVSTEFQLLAIQIIPSSNCSNTKPSGETLQVAQALWQPLTSAVSFFNEENAWAKSESTGESTRMAPQITSGNCGNAKLSGRIPQTAKLLGHLLSSMVFFLIGNKGFSTINLRSSL